MEILGEAADTTGWPDWVKAAEPDVILLDWELPGLPAAALVPTLRDRQPGVHAIALSGRPEARQVAQDAGAGAFVSKGEPPECPISAIAACGPASGATLTVPAPTEEATNTPAPSPTPRPTPEPRPTPVAGAGRFGERFEGSLDGWQQGADVPDDPVRPGQPVAWSIEVSSEQAAEGDGRQGGDALSPWPAEARPGVARRTAADLTAGTRSAKMECARRTLRVSSSPHSGRRSSTPWSRSNCSSGPAWNHAGRPASSQAPARVHAGIGCRPTVL